jgi:hypothetical protein
MCRTITASGRRSTRALPTRAEEMGLERFMQVRVEVAELRAAHF